MPYDDFYIMAGELTHIYAGAWWKKSPGRKVNASIGVVMSDIYLWSLSEIKSQKQTLHSNGDLKQKRQGEPKKHGSPYMHARIEEVQFRSASFTDQKICLFWGWNSVQAFSKPSQKHCQGCNLTPSVKMLQCCAVFIETIKTWLFSIWCSKQFH